MDNKGLGRGQALANSMGVPMSTQGREPAHQEEEEAEGREPVHQEWRPVISFLSWVARAEARAARRLRSLARAGGRGKAHKKRRRAEAAAASAQAKRRRRGGDPAAAAADTASRLALAMKINRRGQAKETGDSAPEREWWPWSPGWNQLAKPRSQALAQILGKQQKEALREWGRELLLAVYDHELTTPHLQCFLPRLPEKLQSVGGFRVPLQHDGRTLFDDPDIWEAARR